MVALVLMAACQSPHTDPNHHDSDSHAGDIQQIERDKLPRLRGSAYWSLVKSGRLRILISKDNPPFSMTAKGKVIGFDVALAEKLGQVLGVKVTLVPTDTGQILDDLTGRRPKGDIAIANLTRNSQRAAQANFSRPYLVVSQAALVEQRLVAGESQEGGEIELESYDSYFDLAKIPSIKIGVKAKTIPEKRATLAFPKAQIVAFKTLPEAFKALVDGKVQAVTHDAPAIRLWVRANSRLNYRFKALLKKVTREPICMAIRKGDLEFLEWLNTFINELEESGLLEKWRKRYIDRMSWRQQ